jgi:hypothetical protein
MLLKSAHFAKRRWWLVLDVRARQTAVAPDQPDASERLLR